MATVMIDFEARARKYRRVEFLCTGCETPWFTPMHGCPRCPSHQPAIPDPVIYTVGVVPDLPVILSAQLRDFTRFRSFVETLNVKSIVDVAADPEGLYTWRPSFDVFKSYSVEHHLISDVWDDNEDLPDRAFQEVSEALDKSITAGGTTLLHCSAGLKRAPHLLYGYLLSKGHADHIAWSYVQEARPIVSPFIPYIKSAHRWSGVPLSLTS